MSMNASFAGKNAWLPVFSCLLFSSFASCCFAVDGTATATTLPNGRKVTPAGETVMLAPFPFAMTQRPDGRQIVAPCIGWPFSLNIVRVSIPNEGGDTSLSMTVQKVPPGNKNDAGLESYTGVVYSPDGKLLYDASGDSGYVDILETNTWHRLSRISLNGIVGKKQYGESFAASLILSADGAWLYVIDLANWRVVAIDTRARQLRASLPTGVNPLAIALSPDDHRLYITNSGLFEYSLIQKSHRSDKDDDKQEGLRFPATGYPSRAAREGVAAEGYLVPGLGSENNARGSSLWTYDVSEPTLPRLLSKLRLGAAITEKPHGVVGGAAPSGLVADREHVYISLAHQDSIAVVPRDGSRVEEEIDLSPFVSRSDRDRQGRLLRGIGPIGMATGDGRLFVAESGINAVAVIDIKTRRVLGHIPTGWYPAAVSISRNKQFLYVLSNKGIGSGPNSINGQRHYIGELEYGSLSALPLNRIEPRLNDYTRQVVANNYAAATQTPFPHTPIKQVFLIIRENRTYDEILGDLPHADGDAKLARYGMHGWVAENAALHDLQVTPNAHALALQFATSDRFSTDSDVSSDGHRWAVGAPPTPWFNQAWTSNYGGRRTNSVKSTAPGRRALYGGNDAPMPEDEPEYGTIWEHVADAGLPVLNYGEGLELEGSDERDGTAPEGQRLYLNSPLPKPVFEATDRLYPTFNLGIPDQVRADEFVSDFQKRLQMAQHPALVVIRLPGDHTAKPRVPDGYPYKASYVADNDLALGRIVDFLSHQPTWKETAIFVIEDDAQDGSDHVDAHRSPILVISPYVRHEFVSHVRTSMTGMQKSIYALLGVGPLNLEDGLAAGLGDMFQSTPDFTPYTSAPADKRLFDPTRAKIAHPRNAKEAKELLDCDDPEEIEKAFRPKRRRS